MRAVTGAARTLVTVGGLVLLLTVSGCSRSPDDTQQHAPRTAAASTPPAQPPATATGGTDEDTQLPPVGASPIWAPGDRDAAAGAAAGAVTAFVRKDLDAASWWAHLHGFLSQTAAAAYTGTDPVNVPGRRVTGPAQLVETSSPYLADVEVPTTAGTYRVLLSRQEQVAAWQVERFTLPGESPGSS